MPDFQESPIKESEEEEDDEDNDSADDSVIRPKTTAKKSQVLSDSEEVRTNQLDFLKNVQKLDFFSGI